MFTRKDEPEVINEARQNHKDYTWMTYESAGAISGDVKGVGYETGRSSMEGLISLFSGNS